MIRPIYLDYHATTPTDPRVAQVVLKALLESFGNPNSVEHAYGQEAAELVSCAQGEVAALVGSEPDCVRFTSGATEGIRWALNHAIGPRRRGRALRVAASTVEHHALISALRAAEAARSVTVRWLPVDQEARLQWDAFELACNEGTDLVCVMAANNEVGTVYPIREIAARAALSGAATLVDGTQAAGRLELSASDWGIGYLIVSGHKLYGPKGVGAVVSEHARSSRPVPESEDQSSGTPNVPGIVGLGEACRLRRIEGAVDERQAASLRDQLQFRLSQESEGLVVNGDLEHRLGGNLHVSVPGVPNDAVLARLHGLVAISTGSACRSGAQEPSHVLRAMALPRANIEGALRIGIGKFTTDEEIQLAARFIANAIADTRSAMKPAFGGDPSSPRSHQ